MIWTVGLFMSAMSCAMTASWIFHNMRIEVNQKLPADERIGVLFGYPGLLQKVNRLHRTFYPESRLRFTLWSMILLAMICFLAAVGPLWLAAPIDDAP